MENKESMTSKEMQNRVHTYISQFKEGYFSPLALMARITEEVGELAREINHVHGEKPKKSSEAESTLEEELGDTLFVLICLANSLNLDMDRAFERTLDKYSTRDKNRWTRIEGDEEI